MHEREIIADAIAEADRAGRDADALLRSRQRPMVRKTFTSPPPQPAAPVMDDATATRWNAWCDERISVAVERSQELLASALGNESGEIQREVNREIETLQTEIAALKIDVLFLTKALQNRRAA